MIGLGCQGLIADLDRHAAGMHKKMAEWCMDFIIFSARHQPTSGDGETAVLGPHRSPFPAYAAEFWPFHGNQVPRPVEMPRLTLSQGNR